MKDQHTTDKRQWVLWNGSLGILLLVTIGRVEGNDAYLAAPFDFAGPFKLDQLETHGRIAFGACLIMSRQSWRDDQAELRREAHERRRAQARRRSPFSQRGAADDTRYREILDLPRDSALQPTEIKAAFRRLAKKAHPDGGGSNERFHRITEARDALLERAQGLAPYVS
ncbi:MAG TPA: J domain-containing protein [Polyangiaceae bacterium]|nr:J domain-containing protein [Polyangiaceae bacterium]